MSSYTVTQPATQYDARKIAIPYRHRPSLSARLILFADILTLSVILWAFLSHTLVGRYAAPGGWSPLSPLLPFFLVLYWLFGSYPGVSVNPVAEIRSITIANASVFLLIALIATLHHASLASVLICLAAFCAASLAIPLVRTSVRKLGSRFHWWGYPVVLLGGGDVARSVLRRFKNQPHLGLRPVAVVSDFTRAREIDGVPVFKSQYLTQMGSLGVQHAIVAAPELSQMEFEDMVNQCVDLFPQLIIIPDTAYLWKVGAYTRDLMGILGIQVRNNLLDRKSRLAKRAIDLASATLLLVCTLPVMVVVSMLIVLETGFPIFYAQERLGRGGQTFRMLKFRTMLQNSKEVLAQSLAADPELRAEWQQFQKLRKDPRVSRVGAFLRKASLDELPQLWNVLNGEMSLVGPRPIIEAEVERYQEAYMVYRKTVPGLTGLWQVSGRNRTTYAERVAYDCYYVRNWSVWMDIYLLAKTVAAVVTGDGAY
jgi:Undecaprenyl-phosphate galactose phosphotransferase WbaP